MDFSLSDEEQAIRELTEQILGDLGSHERLKMLSASGDRIDTEAWAALARSGVVGAAVPEEHGGLGLGYLATAVALQVVGATASPVPLLSTAVMASMPIAEFGTPAQRARWLPAIADGSLVVAAALHEDHRSAGSPQTSASVDPTTGDLVVNGVKPMVADALDAGLFVVPARLDDGSCGIVLIPAASPGLTLTRIDVSTTRPQGRLEFDGVRVSADALLGDGTCGGAEIVAWIEQRAGVGLCMMMAGAARSSIELAAAYTKKRHQFDRPVATFQAVSNRAGDSYIDTEAITLTAWQAAWRIDQGLDATAETAIARWWASEAGSRVVHAAVHVHGGVGVDRDYPLHRHFLLARQIELSLGTGEEHLAALGARIAAAGPAAR